MLFRKDIDPRCAYCARGSRINDEQVVRVWGACGRWFESSHPDLSKKS